MRSASTEYKLMVLIPDGNGVRRIVSEGSKKVMTAAAKRARKNNPHLTYSIGFMPGYELGDDVSASVPVDSVRH
jgi:hypothetical protein